MHEKTLVLPHHPLKKDELTKIADKGIDRIHAVVTVPFDDVVRAHGWQAISVLVENAAIEPCAIPLELEYWPIGLQTESDGTASIMFELRMRFEMA